MQIQYRQPEISKPEFDQLTLLLGIGILKDNQDWDLLCEDEKLLPKIIEIFASHTLTESQQFELASILVSSCDRALEIGADACLPDVRQILLSNPDLFAYHIHYWADEEDNEPTWAFTETARDLLKQLQK